MSLDFPAAPLWRATDPKTSREAGLQAVGDRLGVRAQILRTLADADQRGGNGLTDFEIARDLRRRDVRFVEGSAIKRRGELVRGGWVQPTLHYDAEVGGLAQMTRANDRDCLMGVWRISERGRSFLFEIGEPAACGAPMVRGLNALVCSTHGAGCTSRPR